MTRVGSQQGSGSENLTLLAEDMVKKTTTAEMIARDSCDQKEIHAIRLHAHKGFIIEGVTSEAPLLVCTCQNTVLGLSHTTADCLGAHMAVSCKDWQNLRSKGCTLMQVWSQLSAYGTCHT